MKTRLALGSLGIAAALCLAACGPSAEHDSPPLPLSGEEIYRLHCAACHQPDGSGIPKINPPLGGSARVNGDREPLITLVLLGMKGPQTHGGRVFNGIMPSWKDVLSPGEIAQVLTYIRSNWGNSAPAISSKEVEDVYRNVGASPLFISPAELDKHSP